MRALTVKPGTADSGRVEEVPEPPALRRRRAGADPGGRHLRHRPRDRRRRLRLAAARTGAPDARARVARPGARSPGRQRPARRATWSSASSAGPTRCRAPTAGSASGTCAATASTPSAASRSSTATARSATASTRSSPSRSTPHLGHMGVLLEPASVLAKAWEHVERIGERALWKPRRVLVTGAGPIGLLAALMGRQRGLEVRRPRPRRRTGRSRIWCATWGRTTTRLGEGAGRRGRRHHRVHGRRPACLRRVQSDPAGCIVCLTGISSGGRTIPVDVASLNKTMVLENDVVFGSVNANRRHYEKAADALAKADPAGWAALISRRVPWRTGPSAAAPQPDDVKTVIELSAS